MNISVAFDQNKDHSFHLEQVNFIDSLVEQYQRDLTEVENTLDLISQIKGISLKLLKTCGTDFTYSSEKKMKHLLLIHYWNQVYVRSNISYFLDSETKTDWQYKFFVDIENKTEFPEFNPDNIRSTLEEWYLKRESMFIDRVDAVFRSLSKTHITNAPEGFSKKMIFGSGCDESINNMQMSLSSKTRDILHDLACCLAIILEQPVPCHLPSNATNGLKTGVRHKFYGGSFELQVFLNGSVHLWVNPSLAIDLNIWLAKKYPSAIATHHRVKPSNFKEFEYHYDFLTLDDHNYIVSLISDTGIYKMNTYHQEVKERFAKFIGLSVDEVHNIYRNDRYRFIEIGKLLLRCGYPNIKDHQFYPTTQAITQCISDYLGDRVNLEDAKALEPSAGTGNLARIFSNTENLTCVEINEFLAGVLNFHKLNCIQADFLKLNNSSKYDLIVMNPPYANKRLEMHLAHALTMLKQDGEIILIALTGKHNTIKDIAKGYSVNIIANHKNEFADTTACTSVYSIS